MTATQEHAALPDRAEIAPQNKTPCGGRAYVCRTCLKHTHSSLRSLARTCAELHAEPRKFSLKTHRSIHRSLTASTICPLLSCFSLYQVSLSLSLSPRSRRIIKKRVCPTVPEPEKAAMGNGGEAGGPAEEQGRAIDQGISY